MLEILAILVVGVFLFSLVMLWLLEVAISIYEHLKK